MLIVVYNDQYSDKNKMVKHNLSLLILYRQHNYLTYVKSCHTLMIKVQLDKAKVTRKDYILI